MEKTTMNICEVCGSSHLEDVLDLGDHPLCDDLKEIGSSEKCKEYPIKIKFCDYCKTAFQSVNVVKTELFSHGKLDASNIKVVTENGEVFLMGLVTKVQADTAVDIARNVGGVNRVFKIFEYIK